MNAVQENECGMPRRDFLRLTALATVGGPVLAQAQRLARFVPADKGPTVDLSARGERAVYRGDELKYIGMPVGGICAGQVYLGGDGRLWLWDVFNEIKLGTVSRDVEYKGERINALSGANYVDPPQQVHPFAQGFALRVGDDVRPFEAGAWREIAFTGEYPMGFVEYRDPACPVAVSLEAYSPFVPLDADASSLPAVVMRYTLKNASSKDVTAEIGGWMENPIGRLTIQGSEAVRENLTVDDHAEFRIAEPPAAAGEIRPTVLFEDWTEPGFGRWTATGEAFGPGSWEPDKIPGLRPFYPGPGKRVVKSYRIEGDRKGPGRTR